MDKSKRHCSSICSCVQLYKIVSAAPPNPHFPSWASAVHASWISVRACMLFIPMTPHPVHGYTLSRDFSLKFGKFHDWKGDDKEYLNNIFTNNTFISALLRQCKLFCSSPETRSWYIAWRLYSPIQWGPESYIHQSWTLVHKCLYCVVGFEACVYVSSHCLLHQIHNIL